MKKRNLLILLAIIIILMTSSCKLLKIPEALFDSLSDALQSQEELPINPTPKSEESMPFFQPGRESENRPIETTLQSLFQSPDETPIPTPEVFPPLISTKMQENIWFTYAFELWDSAGDPVFPNLQHKRYPECQIFLNNGHGMSEAFVSSSSRIEIERVTFTKTEWRYAGTNDVVLVAYSWKDSFLFTVENPEGGVLREQCLIDAQDVLRYSIIMGFEEAITPVSLTRTASKPAQEPQTTQASLPMIVYAKDENIWAYLPDTQSKLRLTQDGGTRNPTEWLKYQNPKLSPDGRYVAYDETYGGSVQIYDIQTGNVWFMKDYDVQYDAFDHLMGWDRQGRLYFSRRYGACGSADDKTATALRFDINRETIEYLDELPVSDTHGSGAYGEGFDVSSSGRYFSYYETYCNPAFPGIGVLYDSQTEMYMNQGVSGTNSLSHNEQYLAYPHGYKFDEMMNIYVMVKEINGNGFWKLENFEGTRTLWGNPHWSFDDRYLVISQNSITDPSINDYTPDIWWSLSNTDLVLIDFQDPSFAPVYITPWTGEVSNWQVVKWSSGDYRMLIVQRPSVDDYSGTNMQTLWVYNPLTGEMISIDTSESIDGADW